MLRLWLGILVAAVVIVAGRRIVLTQLGSLGWEALRWFMRRWHGCTRIGTDPLPATGPAIVIADHRNHADPGFLIACCRRRLCFLQAREQFEVFLLWRLFRWAGCIPVARDGHDVAAVRQALRRLQKGDVVAIFPGGDIYPERDGVPVQAKAGAALLALRSRAPVFPARIRGARRGGTILGDWFRPSPHVQVAFGPAIDLTQFYGRPITRPLLQQVTASLAKGMEEDLDTETQRR